jgi:hypothetical protein
MRFFLRTHTTDVRYWVQTYGLSVDVRTYAPEPGRTLTVWQGNPIFTNMSHSSYFPWFRVVLVELGLIEGFPQIWKTRTFWSLRRRVSIQVSFNSHNAYCYFPCTAHLFCVPSKHEYFTTLTVCTYCTWTLSFWEKRCVEPVNQVRLVKRHACNIQTR